MKKSLIYTVTLGFFGTLNALSDASKCPSTFSLGELKEIISTPSHTTIHLDGFVWKIGPHSPVDFSKWVVIQELQGRKNNGRLECSYNIFVGAEPNPQQTITLSKNVALIKQPN